MRRITIITGALLVLLVQLNTASSAQEPLRIAYCQDCAPFQMRAPNGKPDGILIDFWRLWQTKTGREIAWIPAPWAETLRLVGSGEADVHAGLFKRPDREIYLDYGDGILETKTKAFLHRALPRTDSIADLQGYRIGVLSGDAVETFLIEQLGDGPVVGFDTYSEIAGQLKSGALKVIAADTESALYHFSLNGLNADYPLSNSITLYSSNWHVAVTKGKATLLKEVNWGFNLIHPQQRINVFRAWAGGTKSENPDELIIALFQDYAPMSFVSPTGEPAGMLVDFWRRWAEQVQKPIAFRMSDWPGTLDALRNGTVDIHSGLFISEERDKWMDFSQPIHLIRTGLYSRAGQSLARLEGLDGRKLGILGETYQEGFVRDTYPAIDVVPFQSDQAQILALLNGSIDAVANELLQTDATLSRLGYSGLVQRGETFLSNGLHAGVLHGRDEVLELVRRGLSAIPAEEMAAIERRWLSNPDDHFYAPTSFRLSDEEREWLERNAPLTVAVTNFIEPVDVFTDEGVYTGFNADLIDILEEKLETEIVPEIFTEWQAVVDSVMEAQVDFGLSLSRTEEREAKVLFTDEYANDPLVLITTKANRASIRNFDDLADKRTGILKGIAFKPAIEPLIGDNGALLEFENDEQGFRALAGGEIQAYASSLILFGNEQRKRRNPALVVAASKSSEGGALRIAVPKSKDELHRIMVKALASIPNSTLADLKREWIEPPENPDSSLLTDTEVPESSIEELTTSSVFDDLLIAAVVLGSSIIVLVVVLRRIARGNAAALYESKAIVVASCVVVVSVLGATVVATMFTLDVLEHQTRERLAGSLKSILIGRNGHLTSWAESNSHEAEMLVINDALIAYTQGLVTSRHSTIESALRDILSDLDVEEFSILDEDGKQLLSSITTHGGQPIDWLRVASGSIDRVLSGKPSFVPPINVVNTGSAQTHPKMFFGAPLPLGTNQRQGALLVGSHHQTRLTDVLSLGAFFSSGETYAFNRDGYLVSESRFGDDLVRLGMIEEPGQEVLSVRVVDPGENLLEKETNAADLSNKPLTMMALAAINEGDGVYVEGEGYRDYRGVSVFGAWLWNEELNIGLATEVDVDEALGQFRTTRTIILSVVSGVVLVGLSLTGFSVWTGRSAALSLAAANADLEERVEERTREAVESEERVRSLLEVSPIGFALTRFDGEMLIVNKALKRILGLSFKDEMPGSIEDVYEDPTVRQRYVNQLEDTGQISSFEAAWRTSAGDRFWVTINASMIYYEDDLAILAWIDDITQRKQDEDRVAQTLEELRAVLEAMDYAIIFMDDNLNALVINRAFYEIWRINPEDIPENPHFSELIYYNRYNDIYDVADEDFDAYVESRLEAIKSGPVAPAEFVRKDGVVLQYQVVALPSGGRMLTYFDITERKNVEESIRRSEETFKSVLNQMPGSVAMKGIDDRILLTNTTYNNWFGAPGEDAAGKTTDQVYSAETTAEFREIDEHIKRTGESVTREMRQIFPDGVEHILEMTKFPVRDTDGTIFAIGAVDVDITERKKSEDRLNDAYEIISGSIQYASRIQRSLLPTRRSLDELFHDYFILWEPRDSISGDMYWMRKDRRGYFIALFDCTGHGVPGALMTTIAYSALATSFAETGDPGRLLSRVNQQVKMALRQDQEGTESDDGLEIGICYVEPDRRRLTFAGAKFDLLVANGSEIEIIKGDKVGLGYKRTDNDVKIRTHSVRIRPGTRFYLYSDGLTDQIGGERRRAFGRKRLVTALSETTSMTMTRQGVYVTQSFNSFQGDENRRDDVSMIGFQPFPKN